MIAKVLTFGTIGIEAYPVEIEVDASGGLSKLTLVGMADTAIRESKERVKSAIKNSGFEWPKGRITVSLAPSDIKKEGSAFDLAIAVGILAASQQIDPASTKEFSLIGELSLDGSLRQTRGILPMALSAARSSIRKLVIPRQNAKEAAIVSGVSAWPLQTLQETVHLLHNPQGSPPYTLKGEQLLKQNSLYPIDFSEVKGNYYAKRALEIAVAGGHNVLMMRQQYALHHA